MTEAPGPDIALHGVTKRFGAHVAVDDVLATALLLVVLGLMVLNVVLQRRLAQRDAPGLRAAPAPA